MTMEKNGAISSATPNSCGNGCGCNKVKQANSVESKQLKQLEFTFPEDTKTADAIDKDTMKEAIDCVKNASTQL
jgi:hypothetical protein